MSPLEQSRAREKKLVQGLINLAQKFGITWKNEASLGINSNGEFALNVLDQSDPNGPQCGQYGDQLASWLNKFNPRCGIYPGAILLGTGGWCWMNHFDVERLLLATGCINGSVKEGTRYHHYQNDHPGMTQLERSRIEGESGVYWLLFQDKELAKRYLEVNGEPTRTNSGHDCSGKYFDRGAHVRRETKTKVLIEVLWGYDI